MAFTEYAQFPVAVHNSDARGRFRTAAIDAEYEYALIHLRQVRRAGDRLLPAAVAAPARQ